MKRALVPVAAILVASIALPAMAAEPKKPTTTMEKVSYSLGVQLGRNLKAQDVEVDPALLLQGIKDGLAGTGILLSDEEIHATMTAFQQEVMNRQKAKMEAAATKNKADGETFMAANKTKPGVQTLADGLQYRVIKEGDGPTPKATDTVSVNYRGTLVDGTEFDSSYKRNVPASFPLNRVIKGWSEALQMMKVGSKWQIVIPPDLAYGIHGSSGVIPPNATLIFEVELLGIESPQQAPAQQPGETPKTPKQ
jgi:FKBP-type peptidyl-prolyl cis-trans isomerase FklB